MTDCRPVSLISTATVRQIAEESGTGPDKRRFRANVCADLATGGGFAEDGYAGKRIQIGARVILSILDRDPRCKMITLDPDTSEASPEIMRRLARDHETKAGVYAAVLVEGVMYRGDEIALLD